MAKVPRKRPLKYSRRSRSSETPRSDLTVEAVTAMPRWSVAEKLPQGAVAAQPAWGFAAVSSFLLRRFGRLADDLSDGVLDHRSFEELRVHRGPQCRRIDERKIAEILRRHQPVFNQLVRFLEHLAHIGHVPVSDVRTQHRIQPRAVRIHP